MKRIVLGVVAGLSLITAAACGSSTSAQSKECKDYITCFEKTGGTKGAQDTTYGPSGTCWSTGVVATADSCTAACKAANAALKTSNPDAGC